MKLKLLISVGLLTAVVAITACGAQTEAAPEPEGVTLAISGYDNFAYDPAAFSVPSGSEVTVNFKNEGGLDHNFVLVSSSADPLTVTEANAIGGINAGTVSGGGETTLTFNAPPPGTYQYVCTIAGHAAGGMVGTMTVEE